MSLPERVQEYRANVWNHVADPFQLKFDVRRNLTPAEVEILHAIAEQVRATPDDAELAEQLRRHLGAHGRELMALLLQLCGLTRSKIITDLKAQSAGRGTPSGYGTLHQHESWATSGPYLAANVRKVFGHVPARTESPRDGRGDDKAPESEIFEAINQATYPGFIRQERAKRSGGEAEYRLAVLMRNAGIPFDPAEKAENPLCKDRKIHDVSFDLVVPSAASAVMCVKCTVHTANIGQYGESKDALEVIEAATMLRQHYQTDRPALLALVDGVGFFSNTAGLNDVLSNVDEFCQFSTIWKAVVMAACLLGRRVILTGEDDYLKQFAPFLDRHPCHELSATKSARSVEAGRVWVEVLA